MKNLIRLKKVLDSLDKKLTSVFLPWALQHPMHLMSYSRLISSYKRTRQLRETAKSSGLIVPPFLILSITSRCNLHCTGCYAAAAGIVNQAHDAELGLEQWRRIIVEASALGVFGFVIAGGEPFLFPGLLDLIEEFRDKLFLIVTNGTAITNSQFKRLSQLSNIAIIVSIEGGQEATDMRRGKGVHEKALNALKRLDRAGVVTGISITVNRLNFEYWMNAENLDRLIKQEGIRIGVFIEYIPGAPAVENESLFSSCSNDHTLMLRGEERERFRSQILSYRATKSIYLIHSPGDEEYFGGCVSAGRGFAHVTPAGDLTPCPVSNIATHNLTSATLRQGLTSPLFTKIRESDYLLEKGDTPCALFSHPEEVDALATEVGAYRTGCLDM